MVLSGVLSVFLMVLEKVPSCDQERQSALDEARQNPREAIFIPDCGPRGNIFDWATIEYQLSGTVMVVKDV